MLARPLLRASATRGLAGEGHLILQAAGAFRRAWKPHRPQAFRGGARGGAARGSHAQASRAETFTVTTPLYYANADPHMGGAYSTIAADVVARFQRMRQKRVMLITGTDEHGEKIAAAAAAAGLTPQEHCDRIADRYKELWAKLQISYDRFVRTSDEGHIEVVQALLQRVWARGDIYSASYTGRYCVGCEEYKAPDDLDADGRCPLHLTPCPERSEENFFFRLSAYDAVVQEFVGTGERVRPQRACNEVANWISDGAQDFSISRADVPWGIPIPDQPSQSIYVWFDALIGYLSALVPRGAAPSAEALAAAGWPADVHIIGKDILRFHAVFWPGMLEAMGLPAPRSVYGHGFLTKDGMKMGKSLGNVLNPFELTEAYGADAVRFFFMKEIVFGQDGDFSEARFVDVVNASLANDLGNLINRCLNLIKKNCASTLPAGAAEAAAAYAPLHELQEAAEASAEAACAAYEELAFHEAIQHAQAISGRANRLLEEEAPWRALKKGSEEEAARARYVLVAALEAARITAVLLAPVVPALSGRVYSQLALADKSPSELEWDREVLWGALQPEHKLPKPRPVFARIEGRPRLAVDAVPA